MSSGNLVNRPRWGAIPELGDIRRISKTWGVLREGRRGRYETWLRAFCSSDWRPQPPWLKWRRRRWLGLGEWHQLVRIIQLVVGSAETHGRDQTEDLRVTGTQWALVHQTEPDCSGEEEQDGGADPQGWLPCPLHLSVPSCFPHPLFSYKAFHLSFAHFSAHSPRSSKLRHLGTSSCSHWPQNNSLISPHSIKIPVWLSNSRDAGSWSIVFQRVYAFFLICIYKGLKPSKITSNSWTLKKFR